MPAKLAPDWWGCNRFAAIREGFFLPMLKIPS